MAAGMSDLTTFALAFALVWGGLAAYLLRLHLLARRLEDRMGRGR
jgi:hypothetical protein